MSIILPEYIGDGVYAHFDDERRSLVLTTGCLNPAHADNIIIFEPDVLAGLRRYIDRIPEHLAVRPPPP